MTMPLGQLGLLNDIEVHVTVELGAAQMRLRDVLALSQDRVIMLDRLVDEPLDLLVNGKVVARGEVVAEGNRFGLRIVELVGQEAAPMADAAAAKPARKAKAERRAPPPIVEQI